MTLGGVDQTTPFDTALKDFASASSITSSSTTAVAAYYSTTRPTRPRLRRSMRERRRWWLTSPGINTARYVQAGGERGAIQARFPLTSL